MKADFLDSGLLLDSEHSREEYEIRSYDNMRCMITLTK